MVTLGVRDRQSKDEPVEVEVGGARPRSAVERSPTVSEPSPKKAAHWFYSVPFAGVRYYVFDRPPPGREVSVDRTGGVEDVGKGTRQTEPQKDTLAVPDQM